jgi:hypothetical protein
MVAEAGRCWVGRWAVAGREGCLASCRQAGLLRSFAPTRTCLDKVTRARHRGEGARFWNMMVHDAKGRWPMGGGGEGEVIQKGERPILPRRGV